MAIGVFSVINGFQNHTKPFVGAIVAKTTGAIGEKVCSLFETDTKIQQVLVETGKVLSKGLQLSLLSWFGAVYFGAGGLSLLGALSPILLLIPHFLNKINFSNEKINEALTLTEKSISKGVRIINIALPILGVLTIAAFASIKLFLPALFFCAIKCYFIYEVFYNTKLDPKDKIDTDSIE
jgi:hypothetical protein